MQNIKINKKTGNVKYGTLCEEPTLKHYMQLLQVALNKKDGELVKQLEQSFMNEEGPSETAKTRYLFYYDWATVSRTISTANTGLNSTHLSPVSKNDVLKSAIKEVDILINTKIWERKAEKGSAFPNKNKQD